MGPVEYIQIFDVMYVSDGYESSIALDCKIHLVIVACKLYINSLFIFVSNYVFMLQHS
jgi:hypothetical protein